MISLTAILMMLIFYGWSKLGDEVPEPKQPYIRKASEPQLLLMSPAEGGEQI